MSDGSSGAMTDTAPQSGSLDYEALSYVPYDQHIRIPNVIYTMVTVHYSAYAL